MAALTVQGQRKGFASKRERSRLFFYLGMFAIPLIQFAIFYWVANFNSILISFQKYEANTDGLGYTAVWVGLTNFKKAWSILFSKDVGEMVGFSLIFYGCNLFIVTPLALIFSFYIAKNYRFSGFFRVMLYLPCVLSAVVLTILYKYVVTDVYRYLVSAFGGGNVAGLLDGTKETQFKTILFYNLWLAYGTNTMLYTGAMTDINPSIIEAAKVDGAGPVRQFIHIYVPMIWPTLVTFIVTGMAGLFVEQMQLYSFFGGGGSNLFSTFGYYFYTQSVGSNLYVAEGSKYLSYPELSALGVLITLFLIPVVLTVRKLLTKYGPSVD
ncbi:MAG: sugar ABC transporter permease [Bacilli bacterium]|nr:sugar ABC transporter permease [Bacilli bacterium]